MHPRRPFSFFLPGALAVVLALPAHAQDPHCDSVAIHTLEYHPYTDTALIVVAQSMAQQFFFSYPQFSLVNAETDTLARESVNFFGLGWAPQTHHVPLLPGMALPASPFEGELVLDYMSMTNGRCVFPFTGSLCPDTVCIPMGVYLYSFGTSELVTTSFTWSVTNAAGGVVGSGTLAIDADDQQQDHAPLCLPPGHYEVHVAQNGDVGEQYLVGVTQGENAFTVTGPSMELLAGGQITLPFSYYAPCIAGTNAVPEVSWAAVFLALDGDRLRLTHADGASVGKVEVCDAQGRRVATDNIPSPSGTIALDGLRSGLYLVRPIGTTTWATQRFILP